MSRSSSPLHLLHRLVVALSKKWGTPLTKQRVWDEEYWAGQWTYDRRGSHNEMEEPLYAIIKVMGASGAILDLGCGSGMTALEMSNDFSRYLGVDVSKVAVEAARAAIQAKVDRFSKTSFAVGDIATYRPAGTYRVILFRESLYYIPQYRIRAVLERYARHLEPDGVILVRLCDRSRYHAIVELLELMFQTEEVYQAKESKMSIFACTPRLGKDN